MHGGGCVVELVLATHLLVEAGSAKGKQGRSKGSLFLEAELPLPCAALGVIGQVASRLPFPG